MRLALNPALTWATARRVIGQLKADPRSIALILVLPSVLLLLFYFVYLDNSALFNRIAPIMVGLFPMFVLFLVTSVTMQRERSTGTLERLMTTRISQADIVCGYALAFSLLALVQSAILTLMCDVILGIDTAAPWWFSLLTSAITGIVGLALGLLGSAFAHSEFQAVQLMPVLIVPQIFLCGLLVPRDQLPRPLELLSNIMPLSYATDAIKEATAAGWTADAATDLAICAACGLAFLALAAATMPRKTR